MLNPDFYQKVYNLTKTLVKIPSIVGTSGEAQIGNTIIDILKDIPYFKSHPDNLWKVTAPGGNFDKSTIMALVEGKKSKSAKTVVLLGHIDTVRVEDFGNLKDVAFNPDILEEKLRNLSLAPEVEKDLKNGNYMFGRGSLDMKSGVAAHMAVLIHLSEYVSEFSGNILLAATPDEEDMSTGAIAALDELYRLKRQDGLEYVGLINSDYTSPLFPGDENHYIYLGTVGKLLPSFFITGRESHVGQCFEGFDANLLAAELTRLFDMNIDLCDEIEDEITPPPVSLKQRDLKEYYDVQIPFAAQCYYNFFTHSRSPEEVMNLSKAFASRAFVNVIDNLDKNWRKYCDKTKSPRSSLSYKPFVYSYQEFYEKVLSQNTETFKHRINELNDALLQNPDIDLREHSLRIVEEVWKWSEEFKMRSPVVVIYFSSAFNPRVYMEGKCPAQMRFINAVKSAIGELGEKNDEKLFIRKFYPYISDMSVFGISDTPEQVEVLKNNMPAWGKKYFLDTEKIRAINIPMANIGPYGKDAHKMYERVLMKYSFGTAPLITLKTILNLLNT